jgi:hypothetical protein
MGYLLSVTFSRQHQLILIDVLECPKASDAVMSDAVLAIT